MYLIVFVFGVVLRLSYFLGSQRLPQLYRPSSESCKHTFVPAWEEEEMIWY